MSFRSLGAALITCAVFLTLSMSSLAGSSFGDKTSLLRPAADDRARAHNSLFLSNAPNGALTLDSVYHFSFSDLGFGSLIFVGRSRTANVLDSSNQDLAIRPPTVYSYNYDSPASFLGSDSGRGLGFSDNLNLVSSDDPLADPPLATAPEPSTWVGGALAFGIILYSQRGRLLPRRRSVSV
jgi:hypothetical protein